MRMGGSGSNGERTTKIHSAILQRVLESTNPRVEIFGLEDGTIDDWIAVWPASLRESARDAVESARGGHRGRFRGTVATDAVETYWDVSIDPIIVENDRLERLLVISREVTGLATQTASLQKAKISRSVRTGEACGSSGSQKRATIS